MKVRDVLVVVLGLASSVTSANESDWGHPRALHPPVVTEMRHGRFELENGLRVFVVENHRFPEVTVSITIDEEIIAHEDSLACGVLIGELLRSGTPSRPREQLDRELDDIEAEIRVESRGVYGAAFARHQNRLVEIMADVVLNPAFDQDGFARIKRAALDAHSPRAPRIGTRVREVMAMVLSGGSDDAYNLRALEGATLEQCEQYYRRYFRPEVTSIMVVGDTSIDIVQPLIVDHFRRWQRAASPLTAPRPAVRPQKPRVALVEHDDPVQSFVHLAYAVDVRPNTQEFITAELIQRIVDARSRANRDSRGRNRTVFGAVARLAAREPAASLDLVARVRKEETDKAIVELTRQLRRIAETDVTEDELMDAKRGTVASFRHPAKRPYGPRVYWTDDRFDRWRRHHADYLRGVDAVTPRDIRAFAEKRISPDASLIVGGPREFVNKLRRFAPDGLVEVYDEDGHEDPGLRYAPEFPRVSTELFKLISVDWSEHGGEFSSDNWVTNEDEYLRVLDDVDRHHVQGGVYIGVAANQNFPYIARIKPEIAFIVDIRLQNRMQHYVYKIIFEAADNRIDFLSMLLSKPLKGRARPSPNAGTEELVEFFYSTPSELEMKERTRDLVLSTLRNRYGISLNDAETDAIDRVMGAFYKYGLNISYAPRIGSVAYAMTLSDSLLSTDDSGNFADCMNSNEDYAYVRRMHLENRIIPLTGNFAGHRALRKIGGFMRRQSLNLTAFYVSNVESYLVRDRVLWERWIENLKALPLTERSVVIRSGAYNDRGQRSTRLQSVRKFIDLEAAHAYWDWHDLVRSEYKP